MKRTEKEQLVSELRAKIDGATALYFTDYTGLDPESSRGQGDVQDEFLTSAAPSYYLLRLTVGF